MIEEKELYEEFDLCMLCVAEKYRGIKINPYIDLSLRGQSAGRVSLGDGRIRINPSIPRSMLANTISHEIAHLIAFQLGDSGHGAIWRDVHRQLGGTGERCHSESLPRARRGRVGVYACSCKRKHVVSIQTRNREKSGRVRLSCRDCRETLSFVEERVLEKGEAL